MLPHGTENDQHDDDVNPLSPDVVPETPPPSPKPHRYHTRAATLLMGVRVPKNTVRANATSLRALARFVTSCTGFRDQVFGGDSHFRSLTMNDKELKLKWELDETRKAIFPDGEGSWLPSGYSDWRQEQLETVRFHMIEFVVNYRTEKKQAEVKPSTMKGYILGIQRAFDNDWGYKLKLLEGPVFNCPDAGLMAVIDNKFSLQQSLGFFTESHNVLSEGDLFTLYTSEGLSKETPSGFQARLIFDIALVTAMRPTALVNLKVSQFTKMKIRDEDVWKIRSFVGSRVGASKTNAGGWNAVREKPMEICIWNRPALDGKLNMFEDVDDYMNVRTALDSPSDRFFLAVNLKGRCLHECFQKAELREELFPSHREGRV